MTLDAAVWILLSTAIVLANVPWILQNKLFVFITVPTKSIWINLAEWFLYFLIMGGFSYLLQNKVMGHVKEQGWEFYVVTLFMFAIFAFPGFIYRYNLKQFIHSAKKSA
ncbi:DUF2818 family protein [Hydrogenovibrio marinus]|uniref:DUF2818 domain-containing protein n=1 Tax=Hydrogenovibrio marinus TaxID=28885 RepID=A0A066ZZC4_HYDMR|nr:DUF2818 family protein [Hydrogenovibrio marinus]KDN95475.1 hypothetical protein EI16_04020 [Hydrogenovibrio marinus]BBN59967.1 hypothetical protein HVMH_1561 [Hydrogenovibrio marinus]